MDPQIYIANLIMTSQNKMLYVMRKLVKQKEAVSLQNKSALYTFQILSFEFF